MMQFDQYKQKAHDIIYRFEIVVVMPDTEDKYYQYEGTSYETYLRKIREAHQQIQNIYELVERPEVTEF